MTDEELNEVYYQSDHLRTGTKTMESCIKSRLYSKSCQVMVSKTSTLASSYTTASGNKTPFL